MEEAQRLFAEASGQVPDSFNVELVERAQEYVEETWAVVNQLDPIAAGEWHRLPLTRVRRASDQLAEIGDALEALRRSSVRRLRAKPLSGPKP